MSVFDRAVLDGPTLAAGPALIGARLVRDDATGRRVGRIVEVEAYLGPDDRASHARFGETGRSRVMFGPAGRAYVYLVYGMYDCLNVVTEPPGTAAALLIRAVAPLEGVESMRLDRIVRATTRRRRLTPEQAAAAARRVEHLPTQRLAAGPGLVAAAFGLDTGWTGLDLCDPASPLRLEPASADEPPADVVASERIGVAYAGEPWASEPWRFAERGHPSVSGPR
ncbi:MAG: DNA-3-methyladenine glycosylase [Chloroflexota bacterium]